MEDGKSTQTGFNSEDGALRLERIPRQIEWSHKTSEFVTRLESGVDPVEVLPKLTMEMYQCMDRQGIFKGFDSLSEDRQIERLRPYIEFCIKEIDPARRKGAVTELLKTAAEHQGWGVNLDALIDTWKKEIKPVGFEKDSDYQKITAEDVKSGLAGVIGKEKLDQLLQKDVLLPDILAAWVSGVDRPLWNALIGQVRTMVDSGRFLNYKDLNTETENRLDGRTTLLNWWYKGQPYVFDWTDKYKVVEYRAGLRMLAGKPGGVLDAYFKKSSFTAETPIGFYVKSNDEVGNIRASYPVHDQLTHIEQQKQISNWLVDKLENAQAAVVYCHGHTSNLKSGRAFMGEILEEGQIGISMSTKGAEGTALGSKLDPNHECGQMDRSALQIATGLECLGVGWMDMVFHGHSMGGNELMHLLYLARTKWKMAVNMWTPVMGRRLKDTSLLYSPRGAVLLAMAALPKEMKGVLYKIGSNKLLNITPNLLDYFLKQRDQQLNQISTDAQENYLDLAYGVHDREIGDRKNDALKTATFGLMQLKRFLNHDKMIAIRKMHGHKINGLAIAEKDVILPPLPMSEHAEAVGLKPKTRWIPNAPHYAFLVREGMELMKEWTRSSWMRIRNLYPEYNKQEDAYST